MYKFSESQIEELIEFIIKECNYNASISENILDQQVKKIKEKLPIELNLPLLFKR
jgi:hypothetical protein